MVTLLTTKAMPQGPRLTITRINYKVQEINLTENDQITVEIVNKPLVFPREGKNWLDNYSAYSCCQNNKADIDEHVAEKIIKHFLL